MSGRQAEIPLGPKALILSKHYYGVLSKSLERLDIDRYFAILHYLNGNNGCSQQQICNALAIDKTAMVKVMNYLIRSGYVSRKPNPEDRREHFIALTVRGKKQTQLVVEAFAQVDRAAFAGFSKEDRKRYYEMTDLLLQNLVGLPSVDLFFNYKKTWSRKPASPKK